MAGKVLIKPEAAEQKTVGGITDILLVVEE